jgi:excisionase family DNA binding protein
MADRLLSASEVADRIGLAVRTVQRMIRTEKLPYCQVTRSRRMVPEGALNEWIKQNTDWPDQSSTESRQRSGMSSGAKEAANVASLHARRTDTLLKDG